MFFLLFLWLMILLASLIFRSIIGYMRQAARDDAYRGPDNAAKTAHDKPQTGFPEKFGPPVETFQDPVCGVFLPETAAIARNVYGQTVYFCSEKCAKAYLAEHAVKAEHAGVRPEVKPSTA